LIVTAFTLFKKLADVKILGHAEVFYLTFFSFIYLIERRCFTISTPGFMLKMKRDNKNGAFYY